jgi:phosphohistidine phosphatase
MKTLLVLRHAKSSWKKDGLADHDRPLNKRGKRDASRMGGLVKDEDLIPGLILSSTALRAHATVELFVEACGFEGELQLSRDLYAAGPEAYIDALNHSTSDFDRVMVVGHNPGLEELVETLTGEAESMPTCALARIDLPISSWQELGDDTQGKLVKIYRPRDIS